MTRNFSNQRRDDMRPSSRDSSSGTPREDNAFKSDRPRLSRDAVDRGWENGAPRRYSDYHPRQNTPRPPYQQQGRPAAPSQRSPQSPNSRFQNAPRQETHRSPSSPLNHGYQQRDQLSTPGEQRRFNGQGQHTARPQTGFNNDRWQNNNQRDAVPPQREDTPPYRGEKPPHFRPAERNDYRPNNGPRPSQPSGYRPNSGPRPNGGPRPSQPSGYRPNNGPRPFERNDYRPTNGPRPAGGPRPAENSGYRPNSGPRPFERNDYRPTNGPRPAGGPRPSEHSGYRPNSGPRPFERNDYRPSNGPRPTGGPRPFEHNNGPRPSNGPRSFERTSPQREPFSRDRRNGPPQQAQYNNQNPRWQSRPTAQSEHGAPQRERPAGRPVKGQFEGDYEHFDASDKQELTSQNTPPYEKHVTRLADGRVLKGPRTVQRQQATFWSEVANETETLISKVEDAEKVEDTQEQPIAQPQELSQPVTKPATARKQPGRKARTVKTVKTARAGSASSQAGKETGEKKKVRGIVMRPSQHGFKWPAVEE
jgi:hypothetical protein